ncbi:MAG: arsenosugar biosynthesis radical SAM protein ArsS [Acidobacteriota bacterium]
MSCEEQLALLDEIDGIGPFADRLRTCEAYPLKARSIDILQMNITRRCNLRCRHCHIGGSPECRESLSKENMKACLRAASHPEVSTLDITGGAPEMHPHLEWFLENAAARGKKLIVRSNGVIFLDKPYRHFPAVYAGNGVHIVVSFPSLHKVRTDSMRGSGTFDRLIAALRTLNGIGYGMPASGFVLDLAHNPTGAYLPGSQMELENTFRSRLRCDYGIEFNGFYCLINCPVGRYLDFLEQSGNLEEYFNALRQSFNPAAASMVMCRSTLSVAPDGRLFDCDFNQALNLPVTDQAPIHIEQFDYYDLANREVAVSSHCFACTAGAGSSCRGELNPSKVERQTSNV